ncbi:M56 family metallopeptidase [Pedobacter jejuensis]|uniref:TonB family protein n=1 Tax=Pedobacter jejuensis TaxID=1268550 RepID=A0A3N0BNJ1_9SPHI|nr:M56 family metallopeptidase [Pedobacter jejuensis]RNL50276.1 TonB family protein [Pedobacter jejuensis]
MSFAHYLLQVNLYLIVFYGCYKLLLDKETYFTLNRVYLVAAGILSLCIPFIRLEWLMEQKAAQQVYTTVKWDAVLQQATIVTEAQEGINWANLLVYIYCGGILFFTCRLIYNLFAVNKLIRNAKEGSAFSFFGKKIIDAELPQSNVIDIHEEAHIKQWHTLDILFFEIIGIITWLNPVIYFYKKAIKNIHEFLADEHAAEFQGDKTEYAMLILSKSFGISPNALTSNFFEKSLVKKRIYMLHKERSKKIAVMKYGIFIPLFALLIVFSSATIRKNEKLLSISEQIPLEKPIDLVQEIVTKPLEVTNDTKPEIKEIAKNVPVEKDWKAFYEFISKEIKYPKEAQENGLQGNSQIKFTIKNGRVNNLINNVDLGGGCDEEVMKAIVSYSGFKNVDNGKYAIKVGFRLPELETTISNQNIPIANGYKELSQLNITGQSLAPSNTDDKKIYDFVSIEKQPEYVGGMKKFYEYLGRSIKYPTLAQQNNVQGKVWLSFTVEKDGSLSNIQITRGLGSGTDEEAQRVLAESPKWLPGIQNSKPVRVKYNININFTLNDLTEPTKAIDNAVSNQGKVTKLTFSGVNNFDGTKNPLIVLDGVIQGNDAITNIKSESIASISVLKDRAATISYGAKGKNGVLIVTTKAAAGQIFRNLNAHELLVDKTSQNELKLKF